MISIIVLSYNAKQYTARCLDYIKANTKIPYELIVIDNASTDGAIELLQARENEITHLVLSKENLGVAEGRNLGLKYATQKFITFLDNDTEVGPEWYRPIMEEFTIDPKTAIVGKGGVDIIQYNPIAFCALPPNIVGQDCDVVPGFCFTFRKELLETIGTEFSKFTNGKFWHEDLEFCRRARLAGYKVRSREDIPCIHHEHKSMGENKEDILKPENQFGFLENAKEIERRMVSDNVLYICRDYSESMWGAYDYTLKRLSKELRELGMVVVWIKQIHSPVTSFDLCKMTDFIYNGYRILPMFLENDRPPKSWAKEYELVDYILAGSHHIYEAMQGEKYKNKVVDLSVCGVDTDVFNLEGNSVDEINGYHFGRRFMFLNNGASQPRKNTENMIKWYCEAWYGNKSVVLVLKDGSYGYAGDTAKLIEVLRKDDKNPDIVHIQERITDEQLVGLYRRCALNGAYFSPHKAEGFGLPIMEAIACGCRVGVTNFGGPKYNLIHKEGVIFFNGQMVPSTFHNWTVEPYYEQDENPLWCEPKKEDVIEWLQRIYYVGWSKEQQEFVSDAVKSFSYKARALQIYKFLKGLK
jgi:GT2 family glycosyltransferase